MNFNIRRFGQIRRRRFQPPGGQAQIPLLLLGKVSPIIEALLYKGVFAMIKHIVMWKFKPGTEAEQETYKKDPRHVAVSGLCKAIREDRTCVDYTL